MSTPPSLFNTIVGGSEALPSVSELAQKPKVESAQRADFAELLSKASNSEREADQVAERFAAGDPAMGIHEVMIAAEKANIGVRFAVTLKNRALEAYRELLNTSI
jgi:flagellar hook-basal body complex protein FliE